MLAKKLELQTETNRFLRRRLIALESKQRPKKMIVADAGTPLTVVSPELQETSEKRLRNVWLDISKVLFQWGRGGGRIPQWLGYLVLDPAGLGLIRSLAKKS